MRETLANRTLTYGLLGLFVLGVAVPLFWMVTTALKPNKDLYFIGQRFVVQGLAAGAVKG